MNKVGMLWWDNSDMTLHEKIAKAMVYYQEKYGKLPTLAIVNPKDYEDCNNIIVKQSRSIQSNHIWIGINDGE